MPSALAGSWISDPDSVWVILEGPESLIDLVSPKDVTVRAIPGMGIVEGTAVRIQSNVSLRHPRLRTVGADPDTVILIRRPR